MTDTTADVKRILGKFAKNKAALEKGVPASRIREDFGVSSANLVDVLLEFEDAFNITITDDELEGINTLGDAVSLIDGKRAKGPA